MADTLEGMAEGMAESLAELARATRSELDLPKAGDRFVHVYADGAAKAFKAGAEQGSPDRRGRSVGLGKAATALAARLAPLNGGLPPSARSGAVLMVFPSFSVAKTPNEGPNRERLRPEYAICDRVGGGVGLRTPFARMVEEAQEACTTLSHVLREAMGERFKARWEWEEGYGSSHERMRSAKMRAAMLGCGLTREEVSRLAFGGMENLCSVAMMDGVMIVSASTLGEGRIIAAFDADADGVLGNAGGRAR